jgi:PIN domain nuclease of toxin-antitoxin system
MITGVADTHAVIWYVLNDPQLSNAAKTFFNTTAAQGDQIGVSSITLVEIVYLIEKQRIPTAVLPRLVNDLNSGTSVLTEIPLTLQIVQVMHQVLRVQVPDMPDRIIAATAVHLGVPLITRDSKIQSSGIQTIW